MIRRKALYIAALALVLLALVPGVTPAHAGPPKLATRSSTSPEASQGVVIYYPSVGINLPVDEGYYDSSGNLAVPYQPVAAWHFPGMAWPGEADRSLLFGHDQPGYFVGLNNSQIGDDVWVYHADGHTLHYRVTYINANVAWNDYSWLQEIGHDQLVLLTCTGWNDTDPRRIVVAEGDFSPPSQPLSASGAALDNSARVSWAPPIWPGWNQVSGYRVTEQPGGATASVGAGTFSVLVQNLTPGVTHTFTVQATNAAGTGPPSAPSNGTVPRAELQMAPASVQVTAGNPFAITVTAYGWSGSLATGYNAGISFTSSDPQASLPGGSISNGSATVQVTLRTAGTQTVTVHDSNGASQSVAIVVLPGALDHLSVSAPASVPPGIQLEATVAGVDAFGNVVPSYSATINILISDPAGVAPASVSLRGGSVRVPITFNTLSPAQTIIATDAANPTLTASATVAVRYIYYFTWFDRASYGMSQDNIHIINPAGSGAPATGTITLNSSANGAPLPAPVNFSVNPGAEQYYSFPAGTIGGPVVVTVTSGPQVTASQRVTYLNSFNEVLATPATSLASTLFFSWFDKESGGMYQDNIHITNPSPSDVSSGTVTVVRRDGGTLSAGFVAQPGQEAVVTWPSGPGQIGGPVTVTVTSGPGVLASQRVTYLQSFNEVVGRTPAQAATTSYFTWFDKASYGMYQDNVHLINPNGSPSAGTVTVTRVDGTAMQAPFNVNPGQETYVTFPAGAGEIGGPVVVNVTSGPAVLASQRVTYLNSFNEVAAVGSGAMTHYFVWFDRASYGMYADNIHLIDPDPLQSSSGTVTVTLLGGGTTTQNFSILPGAERYVTFPAGTIGGPIQVQVAAGAPVIASERVTYLQSFTEVPAS